MANMNCLFQIQVVNVVKVMFNSKMLDSSSSPGTQSVLHMIIIGTKIYKYLTVPFSPMVLLECLGLLVCLGLLH